MMTTYETATRCPKCDIPGEVRSKQAVPAGKDIRPGTTAHIVYCLNERCTWNGTCWVVQVNPDGSVPPPQNHRGKQKVYENFLDDGTSKRIVDSIQRQLDAETTEGAEIRRPQ